MANIFENVTTINYQNQDIPLNGASVEDVLALLKVSPTATKEVRGTKLIISEAAGTKGSETPEELRSRIASLVGEDNLAGSDTTPRRVAQASSGNWVELIPGFDADEIDFLNEKGITLTEDSTFEEVEATHETLKLKDVGALVEAFSEIGITVTDEQALKFKEALFY